jgi:hypothetical protein
VSQQINLYDPALQRKRELLTAVNLAGASAGLIVLLGIWGGVARSQLAALEGENLALDPEAKAFQTQKEIMAAKLAAMKPDPQIEAELSEARARLDLHAKQVGELKKGVGTESGGFAEYLRGFARATPSGLWLTGFTLADGGASMEIRGRMMDPGLLPEYIRRLNGEQAFKGREFSALKVSAGKSDETPALPVPPAAQSPAPAPLPGLVPPAAAEPPARLAPAPAVPALFYEFSLSPMLKDGAVAPADGRRPVQGEQR